MIQEISESIWFEYGIKKTRGPGALGRYKCNCLNPIRSKSGNSRPYGTGQGPQHSGPIGRCWDPPIAPILSLIGLIGVDVFQILLMTARLP